MKMNDKKLYSVHVKKEFFKKASGKQNAIAQVWHDIMTDAENLFEIKEKDVKEIDE